MLKPTEPQLIFITTVYKIFQLTQGHRFVSNYLAFDAEIRSVSHFLKHFIGSHSLLKACSHFTDEGSAFSRDPCPWYQSWYMLKCMKTLSIDPSPCPSLHSSLPSLSGLSQAHDFKYHDVLMDPENIPLTLPLPWATTGLQLPITDLGTQRAHN